MTQTTSEPQKLTDAQTAEMLALTKGADSVELKLTVPDAERRQTISSLGIDALDAQIRQVFFFDTPDLACNAQGVVVRARRVQRRGDDSVIKLRPVLPDQLSAGLRQSENLVVEVDAMPGGFVCSASMKGALGTTDVKDAVAGGRKIHKLFSKEQRSFFAAHAPSGIGLDDLAILGPITVLKAKFAPADWDRRPFVAELWFYPDGSRILELSTKCAPAESFQVAAETKAFLTGRGVNLAGDQQTKTKTALEFFADELASTPQ